MLEDLGWIGILWAAACGIYLSLPEEDDNDNCEGLSG